mgnify:CR=1 FL=1
MKRKQAIEKLASIKLLELSEEERAEQLDIMTFENWEESKDWNLLPKEIQNEFVEEKLYENPNSKKYDQVLMVWLKDSMRAISNHYLCENLGIDSIEGSPIKLYACPCCGSRTIDERAEYDICKVCWWEDNGQDNEHSEKTYGVNYGISLTKGRSNFLKYGIYDPTREDLIKIKEPISKYDRGREFEIIGEYIIEKGSDWKRTLSDKF